MKVILAMIYMRTMLALADEKLTPTMKAIIDKCLAYERLMFKKNKALYLQCLSIAKETWIDTKGECDGQAIHIEPAVCGLYYSVEKEMKKIKFKPTLIDRLYDKYFNVTQCDLETISRKLADDIWVMNEKVMNSRLKFAV